MLQLSKFGVGFFCFFSGEKFWPALWLVQWWQPGCRHLEILDTEPVPIPDQLCTGNPDHTKSQLHIPTSRAAFLAGFRHREARLCLEASSSPFQTGSVRQIKGYFSVQTLPRADSLCRFVVGFPVDQLIPFSYSLRVLAIPWEKALYNSQVTFLIEIFRVWACSIQIGALNECCFVCSLLCVIYYTEHITGGLYT